MKEAGQEVGGKGEGLEVGSGEVREGVKEAVMVAVMVVVMVGGWVGD